MKAKDLTNEKTKFIPVTIEMTFESEIELAEFFARMNINSDALLESYPDSYKGEKSTKGQWEVYNIVKKYFQ